ncbi:uncharacterized protein CANTADRAFT_22556 [Suhomyces tanzawaensis NRRL Y-17324]|uniref:Myb/SANT-like domain-containing protein n=1 Tax=Suhomyces tanzawaensis NRRL Y-17324 TaxID=984487 RepID=A0A1E4SGD6_9ASCO|nr:uncharacterized protein CANTADRAFT_22556 [Suhomyces tanzawaensis NRRL Y-17324]ODV78579.1 hypothetical protein CANTADRAFT_22556 [Suhomyces tanzawaensis NRRL Y-17324]
MTRLPETSKAKDDRQDGAKGSTSKRNTFQFTYDSDNGLLELIFQHKHELFTRGNTIKTWETVLSEFNLRFDSNIVQTRTINNRFKVLRKNLEKKLLNDQSLMMEIGLNENENLLLGLNEYLNAKKLSGTRLAPPQPHVQPSAYLDTTSDHSSTTIPDHSHLSPMAMPESKSQPHITSPMGFKLNKTSSRVLEKPPSNSPRPLSTPTSSTFLKPTSSYMFSHLEHPMEVHSIDDPSHSSFPAQMNHPTTANTANADSNPQLGYTPNSLVPAPPSGRLYYPVNQPPMQQPQTLQSYPVKHPSDVSYERDDTLDYEVDELSRKRKRTSPSLHTRSRADILDRILESQNRLNDNLEKINREFQQFKQDVDYKFLGLKELLAQHADRVDLKLDSFYRALLAHTGKSAEHNQ